MCFFFGRLSHWPVECSFCWNQQCTSEITCVHFWDWLDDKHGCPVSRTTQRFAEPCSWAYCNRLGQMVEDEKKDVKWMHHPKTYQLTLKKYRHRSFEFIVMEKMYRYILHQFYVCTSGSVGFHSDWISQRFGFLLMTPFTLKVGTLQGSPYPKQQRFWSQLSGEPLAFENPLVCVFFGLDSFLRKKFLEKMVGGGDDREGSTNLLVSSSAKFRGWLRLYQNLRENFERPRSQMLLAAHSSPQPRPVFLWCGKLPTMG